LSSSVKYVDDLVATIKQKFCNDYKSIVSSKHPLEEVDFTDVFKAILAKCEERAKEIKGPKSFWDTKKGKELAKTRKDDPKPDAKKPGKPGRAVTQDNNANDDDEDIDSAEVDGSQDSSSPTVVEEHSSESSDGLSTSEIEKNRQRMMAKLTAKKGGAKKTAASSASSASPARRVKENAPGWGEKRMSKAEIEKLNFGPSEGGDPLSQFQGSGFDPNSRATSLDDSDGEEDDLIDDDEIVDTKKDAEKKKPTGGLMGFFKSFSIIGKELTRDDVDPVLQQIKTHLVSKNVASDIAEQLAESVGSSLVGKQMGSFTRSYLHFMMKTRVGIPSQCLPNL
jgi:signal recognition particle receptor subunit alpha